MQTGVVTKDRGEKKKKSSTTSQIITFQSTRRNTWWSGESQAFPQRKKLNVTSSITSFPSAHWHATSQAWTKDSAESFKNASKISFLGAVSSPRQYEVTHRTWAEGCDALGKEGMKFTGEPEATLLHRDGRIFCSQGPPQHPSLALSSQGRKEKKKQLLSKRDITGTR